MRIHDFIIATIFLLISASAAVTSEFLQKLGPGDPDYELAKEMQAQGCTMTENQIFTFLGELGLDIGMRQAMIVDLARLGDLRWDGENSYTLVGWGRCP